jgi:hypothetical protein
VHLLVLLNKLQFYFHFASLHKVGSHADRTQAECDAEHKLRCEMEQVTAG